MLIGTINVFTVFYSVHKTSIRERVKDLVKGAYFWHSGDNSFKSDLVTYLLNTNSPYLHNSISWEYCSLSPVT